MMCNSTRAVAHCAAALCARFHQTLQGDAIAMMVLLLEGRANVAAVTSAGQTPLDLRFPTPPQSSARLCFDMCAPVVCT